MRILEKIVGIFLHPLFAVVPTVDVPYNPEPSQTVPKFLLPETAEEYRRRLTAAEVKCEKDNLSLLARADALRKRADALEVNEGTPAQQELNRREASRLRERMMVLRNERTFVWPERIERTLREEEVQKILREGKIVHENSRVSRYWWHEGTYASRREGEEYNKRKLVLYRGRHFLVGADKTMAHLDGVYYWATDSVAQMTDEELRAIV